MRLFWAIVFTLVSLGLYSQKFTISGFVRDKASSEELVGAVVRVMNGSDIVTTNQYGFYSLTLPKGVYKIIVSFLGYKSDTVEIKLYSDIKKNFLLTSSENSLEEIIIRGKSKDDNVKNTKIGAVEVDIEQSKKIPVLFGEQDMLKTLQLLPGISSVNEGNSGFYVRGGDAHQNLIILDEAPVYNASHLLGFFSVFNTEALSDVVIYKGGIPAKYGGRLSSVTDIRMRNGNLQHWQISGGIGLISSKLNVEGPILKNKSSLIFTFRRTYADLILRTFSKKYREQNLVLYFYDLNFKNNLIINDKHRLFVAFYNGLDNFEFRRFGFSWGNQTATLRWNYIISPKWFVNTTAYYSYYSYKFLFDFSGFKGTFGAGIRDFSLKQDYNFSINSHNVVNLGFNTTYHNFEAMSFKVLERNPKDTLTAIKDTSMLPQYSLESAFYLSNDLNLFRKLKISYGLRYTIFNNMGPYTYKTYDSLNKPIDTFVVAKNKIYNTYIALEPRLNATLIVTDNFSIKVSYNKTYQFLHLLSKTTSSNPVDIWIPSTPSLKPQFAHQYSGGFFVNFFDNQLETSIEFFYKKMFNQVEYENGTQIYFNPDIEAYILQGIGRAYGLEFLVRKNYGKITGWIAYTLLKSEKKFEHIENGNWFPARQDRRHDFSLVLSYQFTRKINASLTWVFYNGDAVTFPSGKYIIGNKYILYYSSRNGDRMPDYHRLDLGFNYLISDSKFFRNEINISIYNVYNRKNAYAINFTFDEEKNNIVAERLSLFGTIPSITWTFKFK